MKLRALLARLAWLSAIFFGVCFTGSTYGWDRKDQKSPSKTDSETFILGLGLSVHDGPLAIRAARQLGAQSIRVDAPWKDIETSPGLYTVPSWLDRFVDQANANNITPLLILAYGHPFYGLDKPRTPEAIDAFARYAQFVVRYFRGRVHIYDLWNEWDTHTGRTTFGSADDYVSMAKVVYPKIKYIDPSVTVLSGGISDKGIKEGWMSRFFELGGHDYIDAISIHPYNWNDRFARSPEASLRMVERIAEQGRVANRGKYIPIYITEIGWPTFDGKFGKSTQELAWYAERYFLLASTRPYIKGVWWYALRDQGRDRTNKEHNFGLLYSDWGNKNPVSPLLKINEIISTGVGGRASLIDSTNGRYIVSVPHVSRATRREVSWREIIAPSEKPSRPAREHKQEISVTPPSNSIEAPIVSDRVAAD